MTRFEVTPLYGWLPLRERGVTVDGSATSALVRGLSNATTYTAQVTALHGDLAGPHVLSAPFEPNPVPAAPHGVTASAGERSATVRWSPPAAGGPVQRYRVLISPADVEPFEVPAAQTSVLVSGLRNRSGYSFAVAAANGAGENVSSPSNPVWPGDDVPWYLFPLELTYLLLLGLLAYVYAWHYQPFVVAGVTIPVLREVVPPAVAGVPISIPWFGALGAVLIGLYGIYDHSHRDWQRALNRWHVARPFTGAVLGTAGFVLFTGIVRAAGLDPIGRDPLGRVVYFGIAFVIGFREGTFRLLIKRAADLFFGPGPPWIFRQLPAVPPPFPPAPLPPPAPAPPTIAPPPPRPAAQPPQRSISVEPP